MDPILETCGVMAMATDGEAGHSVDCALPWKTKLEKVGTKCNLSTLKIQFGLNLASQLSLKN
jgi:hypothetical protein